MATLQFSYITIHSVYDYYIMLKNPLSINAPLEWHKVYAKHLTVLLE